MRRTRLNSSAQTVTFRIPTTLNFTDMDSVDLISAFAGSTVFDRQIDVEGVQLTAKDGAVIVTIPDYVMDWHHNDANYVQQVKDAVKQWLAIAGTVKDNTRFAKRMLRDSVNSSRLPVKTQRAIRHSINSARRRARLNCGVARYVGDEEYQTYYFITDDNSFVASFDVEIHENEIEFAGFMRGYSADGYVVNENSVFGEFTPGTDVAQALADFVYDKTGVTVYETENVKEFNNQLLTINKIFTNSRKSRIEKYTELRRASLKSARRLNSGKLFYDDATGEYEEYEYDNEQDAWYQLPDEMYIYKLDLSQFADLVRDGIVSKHEIHEWIDELSEDWGGMPAWSSAKPVDRFEIQDLTKEQYDTWKANFAVESVRFRDELERNY